MVIIVIVVAIALTFNNGCNRSGTVHLPTQANLRSFNTGAANYAGDHSDAIFGFSRSFQSADGLPTEQGYDTNPMWTDPEVVSLWPFASSYQMVPNAWVDDDDPAYVPSEDSTLRMNANGASATEPGGRTFSEVAHPSQKVFMYEEFDWTTVDHGLYVLDPNASVNAAFFDGSVRRERVIDADSAFDASDPDATWQAPYVPLHTFPLPSGGLGDDTKLDLRILWTKGGLKGTDF